MVHRIKGKPQLWIGGLVVLVVLGATALPGLAAPSGAKNFKFAVSPLTVNAGAPGKVFSVTVTNSSPSGSSSNISSLSINVPSQFTVTGTPTLAPPPAPVGSSNPNLSAVVTTGTGNSTCNSGTSQTVNVCGLDPIKRLQQVIVQITANVSCADKADPWSVQPFTGSQLNGDLFVEKPSNTSSNPTIIASTCALSFTPATPDGVINTNVPATVQTSAATSGVSVTLTVTPPSGGAVTIDGTPGATGTKLTDGSGKATFQVQGDTVGTYGLSASATGFGTASDAIALFQYGNLDCNGAITGVTGTRGAFNKDGSTCTPVDYTIKDDTVLQDEFGVLWNTQQDANAALKYTPPFVAEKVDPLTGSVSVRPQVAWYTVSNVPVWHWGVACSSQDLPSPYGTLTANVDGAESTQSITVDTTGATALPTVPFAIVIGHERLWVTGTSGPTSATVLTLADSVDSGSAVRGDGGTTAASHGAGSLVMSTPLTIDPNAMLPDGTTPNPDAGNFAPVCIASFGWTSAGYAADGSVMSQPNVTVIDIGDSYTKLAH